MPVSGSKHLFHGRRGIEDEVAPFCLKNNIGLVPFSPIASGLLSGKITPETAFEKNDDVRNWVPQLRKENIIGNQPIIDLLREYAGKKEATPAQISLAWMLHKYPNVVPIPGSKNQGRILENLRASEVVLTDVEFLALEDTLSKCEIHGHRGFDKSERIAFSVEDSVGNMAMKRTYFFGKVTSVTMPVAGNLCLCREGSIPPIQWTLSLA